MNRQTDRQIGMKRHWKIDTQTYRQTHSEDHVDRDAYSEAHVGEETDRQTDRQTGMKRRWKIDRQAYR